MRSSRTITQLLAAAAVGGACLTVCAQTEQKPSGQDGGRLIRKSGEGGSAPQGQQSLRRRIINRMRDGSGGSGSPRGVWNRTFPDPAPYPVAVEQSPGNFSVSSARDGVLRSAVSQSMYSASNCEVTWSIAPVESGLDLTYVISNRTGSAQALPTLQIGGLEFGDVIDYVDHRITTEGKTLDATGGRGVWSATELYPQSLYAPVIIARNERHAVGLSLQYPLFRYQHQIRTYIGRGAGPNSRTWNTRFHLEGELAPSESREYVVNIRFTDREDWIHTIAPYKEYLAQRGSVRYQQDLRPVWGMAIGDTLRIAQDNPRGVNGYRADLNGWQRDVDYILEYAVPAGFERVMVWAASGVYDEHRGNNFPPQFMAEWTGPMVETESQWSRIRDAGIDLLFWWGRSGQYAERWNDDVLDKFTPTTSVQSRMMLDQWRLALRRGASGVGLDAFTQMDAWHAIPWIAMLRELKPDATIVAEPAGFDLLHLHVPTFLYNEDADRGSHLLADYLVPGRELWVYCRGSGQTLEQIEGYIANGMTVVLRGRNISANDLRDAVERAQQQQQGQQ